MAQRILGPRDFILPTSLGDVLSQAEQIKGARQRFEGVEAQRAGEQAAFGTDLAGVFQRRAEQEILQGQQESFREGAEVFDGIVDSAQGFADTTGDLPQANAFLKQRITEGKELFDFPYDESFEIQRLTPDFAEYKGKTTQDITFTDRDGNTVKIPKGSDGVTVFNRRTDAIENFIPVGPSTKADKPPTPAQLSKLIDEDNARILSTYRGFVDEDGVELKPMEALRIQAAQPGNSKAAQDLATITGNILTGQELTAETLTGAGQAPQRFPIPRRTPSPQPGDTIGAGGPEEPLPGVSPGISSSVIPTPSTIGRNEALEEARRRGLVK